ECYTYSPIVSQWLDGRLNGTAKYSGIRIFESRCIVIRLILFGKMQTVLFRERIIFFHCIHPRRRTKATHGPKNKTDDHDDSSGFHHKYLRLVDHGLSHILQSWRAIGGKFENEKTFLLDMNEPF